MTFRQQAVSRVHKPSPVQGEHGYQSYRDCLRLEFEYRCIYCGSHESEVSIGDAFGGFEIDHFRPLSKFKRRRNDYTNLMWSCHACNRAKSGKWPSQENFKEGYCFVDPDRDAIADHLTVEGELAVPVNGSRKGWYTMRALNLNSEAHRHRRIDRARKEKDARSLDQFAAMLREMLQGCEVSDQRRTLLEAKLATVEARLTNYLSSSTKPWDAISSCLCSDS